jgi:retinol dehydrogenase 12
LILDLADFPTIKKAVNEFLQTEDRLDVLVHNAGLMTPPAESKNKLVSSLTIPSCDLER